MNTNGIFRNLKGGMGYISGVHFQKCSNISIKKFSTLNISTKFVHLRAPSRSRKPLRLAYDSLRLTSRLKPASRGFCGGGVSYGGLRQLTAD